MDVFEAVARRHSYRGTFTKDKIPREDLVRIVQTGIQAPSGCNAQTTSFIVVDDINTIERVAELSGSQVIANARAIIVCVVEHRAVYQEMSFGVEDCSAAIENMLLAVTALGYATVWLDGCLRVEERARKIGAVLGVPTDREVRVVLPVGAPMETVAQREKLPFEKRAAFNAFPTSYGEA